MSEGSLADTIKQLEIGQSHILTRLIPQGEVSPETLSKTKETLRDRIAKAISRTRHTYGPERYTTDAHHIITDTLYAIVVVVVTRLDNKLTD